MSFYLVTGGAGFIGSHIVERLVTDGRAVKVFDNLSTGKKENLAPFAGRITFIQGDILDQKAISMAAAGAEAVFHIAALPSVARSVEDPEPTVDVNIKGTLNVLLAAKKAGARRFVFASSSSVYGDKPVLPKIENMVPEPLSPYAVSKLTGEYLCRTFWLNYGLKTVSLRYFNVFGPRQDPASHYAAVIPSFITKLLNKTPPVIYGDGGQTRDFTYVGNVIEANMRACFEELDEYGISVNVATGERTSVNTLFLTIAEFLGSSIKPIYADPRPGDVRDSQGDISRRRDVLKMKASIPFREGLEKSISWYRENL
jgi:nucleoside-diphosphate-sugar epimerase